MNIKYIIFSLIYLCFNILFAEVSANKNQLEEKTVKTEHSMIINEKAIDYKAIAGTILLKDKDTPRASFFYTAYLKQEELSSSRPITFCFNGGPGSSSAWLHLGAFGPKKITLKENGDITPPYHLENNIDSILDVTDLVFIDPISTGYSKTADGVDPKQFHGVDEDIESVAEFIRLFITKYERWNSPKFIAGESYGTTRAAGVAAELHNKHFIYTNGLLLISSILDYQKKHNHPRNGDLDLIHYIPTYTITAYYHKKLSPDLQKKSLSSVIDESAEFAINQYALALLKGNSLKDSKREEIEQKLSYYTGISQKYIHDANLRVSLSRFCKHLLNKQTIGRLDSRYCKISIDPLADKRMSDPSMDAVLGPYTSAFNQYLQTELGWKQDEKYEMLSYFSPFNWSSPNKYIRITDALHDLMTKNTQLKVFVANGYYDLATPFFATEYTFNHLNLDPSLYENITMEYYDAGHLIFVHPPSLIKLNNDIRNFINKTLDK